MDTDTTTKPPLLNLKNLPQPQPPPSIAELRHISAALSQFLRDYDDLHNHISSVNSAIDEKLSVHFQGIDFALTPLIDSSTNNSVRNVLEGSVVDQNPRGNVSDDNVLKGVVSERKRNECVVDDDIRMHASSDSFINNSDHRVVSEVLEGVVLEGKGEGTESECEQSDEGVKNYEKSDCDDVVNDVLEGVVVSEGNGEGTESECERSDEGVKEYEKSDCDGILNDVLEGVVVTEGKCEESVSESESESESERSDEDAMMYESTNYVKKREESDCDRVVNDGLEGVVLEGKGEGSASECERNDEGVENYEKSDCDGVVNDILEGVVVTEGKCEESESESESERSDEDAMMYESTNYVKKREESDCDRVVNDVLEGGVVSEGNGEGTERECEQSDEGAKNYEKSDCDGVVNDVLEGVVVTEGKCEESVSESESESERSDEDSMMYESINYVKKREESDCDRVVNDVLEGKGEGSASECEQSDEGVKNYEKSDCDGVVNDVVEGIVVTEGKCEGSESESECEGSDEDITMYESDCDGVVNDVLEGVVVTEGKCEGSESESECEGSDEDMTMYESDCDRVVNDVLEGVVLEEKPKRDESDFKRRNEDVKNDEEIDASVKMQESDCAEIITDVPKAVVSDECSKGTVIECEQSDDDVRMCQSPNSSDSCEETDDEDEEIGALKNAVPTCDEGEKIDAAKNVEETDYDPALNERINVFLEEIAVIEKNPIRTASKCDKVRTPQSSSSLENSEETDDEDGEIEASKKPDDADYDRFVTELLEDVDVVPKPNRTASDSDQSYDKPQSPTFLKNHLDEIDVSMNPEDKNHEQTDVSMEPGEIDILNTVESDVSEKREEMDIPRDPAETDVSEKHEEMDISKNPAETDVSEKPEEIDIAKNPEETDVSEKPENVEILKNPKPVVSELERLCKSMNAREMKEYVVKHISDIDKLQTELLKALKLATNPAKLVLDSIGTYFLQSGKTYNRGLPFQKKKKKYDLGSYQYLNDEIDGRKASRLILACFVMISGDGIKISREDKASAAEDANRWKNRVIKEGGFKKIDVADARGLLLLISGFGISDRHFSIVDIMELMRASNVKGISNILHRSIVLMPKIPEVIDMMVKNKLEVEAADIAYTFGLEYKCHPCTILTKFLRNVFADIESGSPVQLEATKQQLDDLRSIKECLESHNIDPSKVLPEFKIDEEIHHLKKKLKLQFQVQVEVPKRKAMDIESLPNPNHQEAKRTCSSPKTMACGISSYNQSMQPGYSYRDFDPNLSSNFVTTYSSSSLLNAPALPVNITNSVTSGLAGPGGNIRPNGWQDDPQLVEKYLPRQSQTYDPLVEKYLPRQSQTYDSQLSSTGLYGRRPAFPVYMPGHPVYPVYFPSGGLPARRAPGSDLYGFADVVEKEIHGSRAVGSGTARY